MIISAWLLCAMFMTNELKVGAEITDDSDSRDSRGTRLLQGETMGGLKGCDSFVKGNKQKKEFYSPNFPLNYNNDTTCVRVIAADSLDEQVELDFRDSFYVEPSEGCRHDYLEVRDGRFGYSPLLGKFCGTSYPPILTSSGSHLWLRFRSDENIEYSGFRAVYRFVKKPIDTFDMNNEEMCVKNITGDETGFISHEDLLEEKENFGSKFGLDCMFHIVVKEGKKVLLQWDSFNLQHPNDCEANYVDVFGAETDNRISFFCGAAAETVLTKENVLQIHLVVKSNAVNSTFKAHFTAFTEAQNCSEGEFNCQDGTCIDWSLRCDQILHCRTGSDEDEEDCKEKETLWQHMTEGDILIILVVFFVIILGMCSTLAFNIVRKLIHDCTVIKEHVTQSRESHLDQLGKKTPAATILTPMLTVLPKFTEAGGIESERPLTSDESDSSSYGDGNGVRKKPNGVIVRGANVESEEPLYAPHTKDSACQTRESLFQTVPTLSTYLDSEPIPPPEQFRATPSESIPFSTFGYGNNDCRRIATESRNDGGGRRRSPLRSSDGRSQLRNCAATLPTFKAEAVIEMRKKIKNADARENRPYSVQSNKSAPDVIVTR